MNVNSNQQREFWLVKVPKYVANAWKEAPKGVDLGKIQIPRDKTQPIKLICGPNIKQKNEAIPSEHTLNLQTNSTQSMAILAQNSGTDANAETNATFLGDVKFKGELKPVADKSYLSHKYDTIKKTTIPTKKVIMLNENVASYKPRDANLLAHEADQKKRNQESKKQREDKDVLQQRLFTAFEKQQYYNIRDLARITNQSVPYLKEVLKEICNYCSKSSDGHKKNMWELKPEFRHYKSASGSQAQ